MEASVISELDEKDLFVLMARHLPDGAPARIAEISQCSINTVRTALKGRLSDRSKNSHIIRAATVHVLLEVREDHLNQARKIQRCLDRAIGEYQPVMRSMP